MSQPSGTLTLRRETAERIRRAAQNRGLDVDQFLQQLIEEADASSKRSPRRSEEAHAFLDDWRPPASLRDWIGLARPEDSDAALDDREILESCLQAHIACDELDEAVLHVLVPRGDQAGSK